MPFLVAGVDSILPRTSCDPTTSSGAGQLGTTVQREYRVGKCKMGRDRVICELEREVDLER